MVEAVAQPAAISETINIGAAVPTAAGDAAARRDEPVIRERAARLKSAMLALYKYEESQIDPTFNLSFTVLPTAHIPVGNGAAGNTAKEAQTMPTLDEQVRQMIVTAPNSLESELTPQQESSRANAIAVAMAAAASVQPTWVIKTQSGPAIPGIKPGFVM